MRPSRILDLILAGVSPQWRHLAPGAGVSERDDRVTARACPDLARVGWRAPEPTIVGSLRTGLR